MVVVNLIIPTSAVLFVLVVSVAHAARQRRASWRAVSLALRDSVLRAVQYVAAVAVLELVGQQEPSVARYTDYAVWVLVVGELAAGFALLSQDGVGGSAITSLLQQIAQGLRPPTPPAP